jgi:hypothetical protein
VSLTTQDTASDIDIFAPRFRGLHERAIHVVVTPDASKLYQHGEIDPSNDFDATGVHDGDCEIGRRASEHVGENDHAMTIIGTQDGIENVLAALIHVIFGADGNGLDEFLWAYDMLHRVVKLFSQLAMRDKHKSDHSLLPLSAIPAK